MSKVFIDTDARSVTYHGIFVRGDVENLNVIYTPCGPANRFTRLGIKETFGAPFLAEVNGTGDTFTLNLNTVSLTDALSSKSELNGFLEVTWSDDEQETWKSAKVLPIILTRDLISGEEGTGLEVNPSPEEWLVEQLTLLGYAPDGEPAASAWGTITGTLSAQSDLNTALNGKVPTTRTVNGHPLTSNVNVTASDLGLGTAANVTFDSVTLTNGFQAATGYVTGEFACNGYWQGSGFVTLEGTTPSTWRTALELSSSDTVSFNVVNASYISAGSGTLLSGSITFNDGMSFVYGSGVAESHRNALGLGSSDSVSFGTVSVNGIGGSSAGFSIVSASDSFQHFGDEVIITNGGAWRTALGLGSLATQSGTFSGTSSGTNTGDQTTITGNAGSATKLQTARTINGVPFDGTANITISGGGGGSVSWGGITGTLSDQSDLNTALATKAGSGEENIFTAYNTFNLGALFSYDATFNGALIAANSFVHYGNSLDITYPGAWLDAIGAAGLNSNNSWGGTNTFAGVVTCTSNANFQGEFYHADDSVTLDYPASWRNALDLGPSSVVSFASLGVGDLSIATLAVDSGATFYYNDSSAADNHRAALGAAGTEVSNTFAGESIFTGGVYFNSDASVTTGMIFNVNSGSYLNIDGFFNCNTSGINITDAGAWRDALKINQVSNVRSYSGTTDTFVLADAGGYVRSTGASTVSQTVPGESSVDFPVGTILTLRQVGAGQITLSGSGVTLNGDLKTAGANKSLQLVKVDADEWDVIGGVA